MFRNAHAFEKTKKYTNIRKDSCVVLPTSCVKEIVPNYIILFMKYILIDDEEKER